MIKILMPWWNQFTRAWDGPIEAYIVPDIAPHLAHAGTFAVHRAFGWRGYWQISNVETGAAVQNTIAGTRQASIDRGRLKMLGKNSDELIKALRKIRRKQRGHA